MNEIFNKISEKRKDISIAFVFASFVFFMSAYRRLDYNMQIISILILYIGILFGLRKDGVLLFLFLSSFMIFLVTRSFIDFLDGHLWYEAWNKEYIPKAISILYLSVLCIYFGFMMVKTKIEKKNEKKRNKSICLDKFDTRRKSLLLVILFVYSVTFIFAFYIEIDKFIFMKGRLYEDYYLLYQPVSNIVIKFLAGINPYLFLLLLALKPKKKTSYILFLLSITLTIPTLLIGQRGDFMLSIVLLVVYYILQASTDKNEKWISKYNIILILIAIPIIIIMMNYVNEGRHGTEFAFSGLFNTGKTFVHKQGVSFDAFLHGIISESEIRSLTGSTNYLFGEMIDFLKYNPLSRLLFNTTPLPSGNNAIKAIYGGSYAHILSYVTHHSYLEGFGFGTSYVLEANHTYGIMGVIIVNLFIGGLLYVLQNMYGKKTYSTFFSLVLISNILYLPRQSFSSLFMFIVHPYFWFVVGFSILVLYSTKRSIDSNKKIEKIINYWFN